MEVRLQAQEAQMIRLANELNTERTANTELRGRVDELSGKLAASASEGAGLREALDVERRAREQLASELRWIDEAGAQARAEEEQHRRHGDEATGAQLDTLQSEVRRLGGSVEAFEQASRKSGGELHGALTQGLSEAREAIATVEGASRAEADRLRAELAEVGAHAELSAEVSELTRGLEAQQQKLQEE
eukprot:4575096-Prymnesium_polylepis.1